MRMTNSKFLEQNLIFSENSLFYVEGNEVKIVMDECENSLMKRTTELLINEGDNLLEVGFGMGIFANYAQKRKLSSHTIVEGHPQVYEKLRIWSEDKDNVEIIFGSWVSCLDKILEKKYDSVYFDTHCDINTYNFFQIIKNNIKSGGRFSRFGLNQNNSDSFNQEVSKTNINFLLSENHPVTPSEHVKYFTGNTFPICVIGL